MYLIPYHEAHLPLPGSVLTKKQKLVDFCDANLWQYFQEFSYARKTPGYS